MIMKTRLVDVRSSPALCWLALLSRHSPGLCRQVYWWTLAPNIVVRALHATGNKCSDVELEVSFFKHFFPRKIHPDYGFRPTPPSFSPPPFPSRSTLFLFLIRKQTGFKDITIKYSKRKKLTHQNGTKQTNSWERAQEKARETMQGSALLLAHEVSHKNAKQEVIICAQRTRKVKEKQSKIK